MKVKLTTPLTKEKVKGLKSGDEVLITGTIYTARDAAHQRLVDSINRSEELPFDLKDSIIYYVGPAPAKPGEVIGSCGPTTSYRMDDLTNQLLSLGLTGMIGKGQRNENVINSMKKNTAVYFAAIGGAGALIANSIKASEVIAYEELGAEAIRKLEVEDFPCIVVIDCKGNNMYETERAKYRRKNGL